MDIHSTTSSISALYFKEEFLAYLEQHLSYIKDQGMAVVTLNLTNAYKHEGNFYGILHELNIPVNYHYICMRVNGLRNSNEYDGNEILVNIPSFDVIEQLKNQYLTYSR